MEEHLETFKRLTGDLPYRPKAIFPSEMFMFYCAACDCGVNRIIESGVGRGGATSYIERLFPDAPYSGVDKNGDRIVMARATFTNLWWEFFEGDSDSFVPKLVFRSRDANTAVLIDGPKGLDAARLAVSVLNLGARLVAVHDLQSVVEATEAVSLAALNSHDAEFRNEFGHLDAGVGAYLEKYPNGPGLTIFHA